MFTLVWEIASCGGYILLINAFYPRHKKSVEFRVSEALQGEAHSRSQESHRCLAISCYTPNGHKWLSENGNLSQSQNKICRGKGSELTFSLHPSGTQTQKVIAYTLPPSPLQCEVKQISQKSSNFLRQKAKQQLLTLPLA